MEKKKKNYQQCKNIPIFWENCIPGNILYVTCESKTKSHAQLPAAN